MNRRRFLQELEQASTGIAVGVVGLGLTACGGARYVQGVRVQNQVRLPRAVIGADVPFVLVEVEGQKFPLYLYHHGNERFTAVSTRCKHRGCQVDPEAGHLVCPCHGSEYSNAGAVLHGPTRAPLTRFAVAVSDTTIVIDLTPTEEG